MDISLKNNIMMAVRQKFIIYHAAQCITQETILNQWANYIYDVIAETDEFKQLLDSNYRTITEFDIDTVAGTPILGAFGRLELYTMYFSAPKLWVDFASVNDLKQLVRLESAPGEHPRLVLLEHPKWNEFHKVVIAHNNDVKTSMHKSEKLMTVIEEICSYYDTLNEALAAWPALRYVLPDGLQEKDFPFDGTPKPLPTNVDVAELTAFITCLKLGL